jgi:haloacetate dehalogenase
MFEGFTRQRIDVGGGIEINCVWGGSGPPVLLLHGLPQTLAMWARVAVDLSEHFTVVCTDLRGYGDSSKPPKAPDASNYSFRAMGDDQVAVMAQLGHDRFHVVGHDRGARVAYRLAFDRSEVVRSLTVLDIVPTYTMYHGIDLERALAYWVWLFQATMQPVPEQLIAASPDVYFEYLLGTGRPGGERFSREQLDEYRRCWRQPEMARSTCADYQAGATIDLDVDVADLEADRKIACPTLAMWGTSGAPVHFFDVEAEWRRFATDVETATIESGHFFIDHEPDEAVGVILDFLRRH